MCKKKFKVFGATTLCMLLASSIFITIPAKADYYSTSGLVSWYEPGGKIGYDGKVITDQDCATKLSQDNPPGGTEIHVTDKTN
ncbi:hypothetical protein [Clostridium manihotivorum]|uniref:Uncharacterized protein n=1 Tax=Clostridium manihotivorum TaxID=2320868 RepID=A0A3R5U8W2_9CLOT|nr:hypothetical protein [Clostridium manihotivorum]QAA32197.1 hypothetical protein C1I91_11395 [Clostridium manihotivorum]